MNRPKEFTINVMNVQTEKQWYSQKEAALAYGVSESTIKKARLEGRLPFSELFGKVVIRKRDIERCIKKVY